MTDEKIKQVMEEVAPMVKSMAFAALKGIKRPTVIEEEDIEQEGWKYVWKLLKSGYVREDIPINNMVFFGLKRIYTNLVNSSWRPNSINSLTASIPCYPNGVDLINLETEEEPQLSFHEHIGQEVVDMIDSMSVFTDKELEYILSFLSPDLECVLTFLSLDGDIKSNSNGPTFRKLVRERLGLFLVEEEAIRTSIFNKLLEIEKE
jgi:hypothetical protein